MTQDIVNGYLPEVSCVMSQPLIHRIFNDLSMPSERACLARLTKRIKQLLLSVFSLIIYDISIYVLQNAVGKMRSLTLVLTSFNLLQVVVHCQELSVIRHSDGDIFTIEGKYIL